MFATLLCVGLAQARSYPTPPTGPWTLGTGAGFSLKAQSKSRIVLSSLRFRSPSEESCPADPGPVKFLGQLRVEAVPSRRLHRLGSRRSEVLRGSAEFGTCRVEFFGGKPK